MSFEAFDAVVLAPCSFHLDPRHEYWAKSIQEFGFKTLRMEVLEEVHDVSVSRLLKYDSGLLTICSNRKEQNSTLLAQSEVEELPADSLLGKFLKARIARMLYGIRHDQLLTLNPRLVIANDFFGLFLANALWGTSNCTIIYDAQEVFTDSYDVLGGNSFSETERRAWIEIESSACSRANLITTVSPGIAELYLSRHGVKCEVLPNYVPLDNAVNQVIERQKLPLKFVLIGRADPRRGLEELIKSWDFPDSIATLDLIMPITQQRKKLEALSKKTQRVHCGPNFLAPVKPNEMVMALSKYDVGILPYNYPFPYSHASPNKFGEYIAAGLLVLANEQPFVASQVAKHSLGKVFDWSIEGDFARSVIELSKVSDFASAKNNVRIAARSTLNWQSAGESVWRFIQKIEPTRSFDARLTEGKAPFRVLVTDPAEWWERCYWYTRRGALSIARKAWVYLQNRRS